MLLALYNVEMYDLRLAINDDTYIALKIIIFLTRKVDWVWSLQALPPVFTFANQAGLDMLETTLVALQDITLEKIFDNNGKKTFCSDFPQIMQQVR